jgi:hypothetical protein
MVEREVHERGHRHRAALTDQIDKSQITQSPDDPDHPMTQ